MKDPSSHNKMCRDTERALRIASGITILGGRNGVILIAKNWWLVFCMDDEKVYRYSQYLFSIEYLQKAHLSL